MITLTVHLFTLQTLLLLSYDLMQFMHDFLNCYTAAAAVRARAKGIRRVRQGLPGLEAD